MKRNIRFFLAFLLPVFLGAPCGLFAFGSTETTDNTPVNTDWILCVTTFDNSSLSVARQITGDTVMRSLAAKLSTVDFRLRGDEEVSYYRNYAWAKSRSAAAQALDAKRGERDLLIYKGDPGWKYKKNLKTVDDTLVQLQANLTTIDANAPVVEQKPAFSLCDDNKNGTYPAPPTPGSEYRFCTDQKVDAFLAGSLSEYHGRILLNIKMFTLYTHSYSYEDFVLFSSEDLNSALDEISGRLVAAVSGTQPSALAVHARPEDAMVMVDGDLKAQGDTETLSHSPDTADIAVRADNYVPFSYSLDLNPGELAELYIELTPLGYSAFRAVVPGSPGSRVFIGSLYVGQTPLDLQLPRTGSTYISVETPNGEIGSMVYKDNNIEKGNAQIVRNDNTDGDGKGGMEAAFITKPPISPEEKRVDKARRGFYGAYGVFWFVLPASLLTAGIAGTYIFANNYAPPDLDLGVRQNIYNNALTGQNVQVAAYAVMGVALGITFIQIFRYLYVSGGDATPIVKAPATRTQP